MSSSGSSSASSSRSPTPEPEPKNKKTEALKRKLQQDDDASDSDSGSDAESIDAEKPKKSSKRKKSSSSKEKEASSDAEEPEATDEPALSHAERRRQQKRLAKQKAAEDAGVAVPEKSSKKRKLKDGSAVAAGEGEGKGKDSAAAKPRQNSVWVGNMSFKTTQENLKTFFAQCGEITRVNLPLKAGRRPNQPAENRGFAYVDFATPEAKQAAVALSEQPLIGRKLLIKDGNDFGGRPIAPGTDVKTTDSTLSQKIHSKSAQKILRMQKQPPGPTLFVGNLPFETTEDDIRNLFESHRPKPKKEKGAWKSNFKAESENEKDEKDAEESGSSDSENGSGSDSEEDSDDEEKKAKAKAKADKKKQAEQARSKANQQKEDDFILKIRMGTFEDSGACKGFTFIDFSSIDNATAALINVKNHHFNGRDLKVEYAGLDAIRRGAAKHLVPAAMEAKGKIGGAPRKGGNRDRNAAGGDREGGNGRSFNARPPRGRVEEDAGGAAMDVDYEGGGGGGGWESEPAKAAGPDKRFRKEFDRKGRARPTPGAALALAKRETAGIVPSQGKKITF